MKRAKVFIYGILYFFISIFGVWSVFAALNFFEYKIPSENSGYILSDGQFYLTSDKSWKIEINNPNKWNAGLVDMRQSGLNSDILQWTIWLQSIGVDNSFSFDAKIIPPSGNLNVTRACWKLVGAIETKNAWRILLDDMNGARVRYNPVSGLLEGYGYNKNLGNVWLGTDMFCSDEQIDDNEVKDIEKPEIRSAFIGRVKIIGNIGANNTIFDTIYTQEKWVEYAQFSLMLNRIRENVFIRSRNISDNLKNKNFNSQNALGDVIFYINESSELQTLRLGTIPDNIRSIVVLGGDVVITENITNNSYPRVIISIQNEKNFWWNIYIEEDVQKIFTSLVAEKSILSGEGKGELYNDEVIEIANIPKNQLYIKWFVASRNTIGGASKSLENVVCPHLLEDGRICNHVTAQIFDLNYFRNFNIKNGNHTRAYINDTLDKYSLIIEYDKNLISNPPSFLEIVK